MVYSIYYLFFLVVVVVVETIKNYYKTVNFRKV